MRRFEMGLQLNCSKMSVFLKNSSIFFLCRRKFCQNSVSKIFAAVLVERPPILAAEKPKSVADFETFCEKMDFERSILNDFELRVRKEADELGNFGIFSSKNWKIFSEHGPFFREQCRVEEWKKLGRVGEDEEDYSLAKNLQKRWEKNWKNHKELKRAAENEEKTSTVPLERKYGESLVLMVKQSFDGGENFSQSWLLPMRMVHEGETLRDAAETCLADIFGAEVLSKNRITLAGNAPFSFFDFKHPRNFTRPLVGNFGAKIFFMKASLSVTRAQLLFQSSEFFNVKIGSQFSEFQWLTKGESWDLTQQIPPHSERYFKAFQPMLFA